MNKAWGVVAVLLSAVFANADLEFFFTSSADGYGLADPSKAFLATGDNHKDYLDGWAINSAGAPPLGAVPDPELALGGDDWAYIWGRFGDAEPALARINGMAIGVDNADAGQGQIAWYKCDNSQDWQTPPHTAPIRFDGDPEVFYFNPAGLIAIQTAGILNTAEDQPLGLYVGGDYRTFLLGAVKLPSWAQIGDELNFDYGTVPVCYRGLPCPQVRSLNRIVCVPEPGYLPLMVLAVACIRRR